MVLIGNFDQINEVRSLFSAFKQFMRSSIHDAYALRSPESSYSPGDSVYRITMTSRGTRILGPDLGREIDCDMIPFLRPKSGSSTDFRLRQLRGTNCYGLFKQLGQGYGGVDFV